MLLKYNVVILKMDTCFLHLFIWLMKKVREKYMLTDILHKRF